MNLPEWVQEIARQPNCGMAFAQLVRDLVKTEHGKLAYSYDHRDGGIDVHIPELGLAWQCKFVNPGTQIHKKKLEQHVKSEIDSEFRKLHDQLIPNSLTKKQSQFEVWNDPTSVKSYTYATSIKLPNATTRAELKTYLHKHLKKLAIAAKLDHLAKANAEIWDQQTISLKIDESPNVRLRWFELDLPPSVEKFSDWKRRRRGSEDDPQKRNFHAYLFGDVLPYQPQPDSSKRPQAILSSLQENSSTGVTLIHGAGGHGKSRLMVEVARCAEDLGWNIFILAPSAKEDLLDALVKITADSPTLLLLDYAEHCGSLVSIYERIRTLNETQPCRIALLMVSRTTALIDGTSMDDPSVMRVHINSNKSDQDHIVKQMLGAELEDLASKCMYIPVFAAFIRLLHDRGQQDSLDDLRHEANFLIWIRRHVAGQSANKQALAKLCSLLPCSDLIMTQACNRDPAVNIYRDSMLADGWLIHASGVANENWQIAHDLIADGAIIDALSDGTTANHHAQEVLRFAILSESRVQCIRALNRIADDPQVASIDWFSLFTTKAVEWEPFLHDIARGSLVPKERLLAMMALMGITISDLDDNIEIRRVLGLIVRDAAFKQRPITDTEVQWIERVVERSQPAEAASFISNWLRSDSSSIRASEAASTLFSKHPMLKQVAYVYSGWLNSERPWSAISAQLNQWLMRYNSTPEAVFPITAWLDYMKRQNVPINSADCFAGESSIGDVVRRWLDAEARYKSTPAGLLYRAWIVTMRDVTTFEKKIITWLALHQGQFVTQLVLGALLRHRYPPVKLSGHVEAWLAKPANVTHPDARYLYANWLQAGGCLSLVRDQMLKWLGSNQQHLDDMAHYVFLSWLMAKGDQSVIKEQLIEWLERPRGALFMVQEEVLSVWLKSEGMNRDDAEPFIQRWCNDIQNAAADRADYLVVNWKNAGGDKAVVRNAIEERARILGISKDVYFERTPLTPLAILAQRIKSADHPALFLDDVQRALLSADELQEKDLDHVLRRWVERMGREGVVLLQDEFLQWVSGLKAFSLAPFTLAEMLVVNGIGELGQSVERLAIDELRSKRRIGDHLYIFRSWVRSGRKLADVHGFLKDWLSTGHEVNNIKCAEILQALQASELGQQEWALRAVNQFAEKHGGEVLSN